MGEGERTEGSGGIYHSIEDKYYDLCDWLAEKGVPVYQYWVEPIEKNGVPSFPVSAIMLFAILVGIGFAAGAFGGGLPNIFATQTTSLSVQVMADGSPVPGAQVRLTVDGAGDFSAVSDSDGYVSFAGLPKGSRGYIEVTAEGYDLLRRNVVVGDSAVIASLSAGVTPPPSQRT